MAKAVDFGAMFAVRDKPDPELDEAIAVAPTTSGATPNWDAIQAAIDLKPIEVKTV